MNITTLINFSFFRSQNHSWQSVADRINELERQQHINQTNNLKNQKFTYLDPSKTTRVPNVTLKAFQKNAVQSYFERQQQQQHKRDLGHQQPEQKQTVKESSQIKQSQESLQTQTTPKNQSPFPISREMLRSNQFNGSMIKNQVSPRPQSMPVHKTQNATVANLSPSRSSLPAKLSSQMTNVNSTLSSGQLASKTKNAETTKLNKNASMPNETTKSQVSVTMPVKQNAFQKPKYFPVSTCQLGSQYQKPLQSINLQSTQILAVEQSNLQSVNESGVPPPPPRRSKPLMPLRRYVV